MIYSLQNEVQQDKFVPLKKSDYALININFLKK